MEAAKVAAVEAFKSLTEFWDIKTEFGSITYLQGAKDLKEKLKKNFPYFNLDLLELDSKEEVDEGGDRKICMEDLFSPAHKDQMIEDGVLALPPTIIVLSDHVEVGESWALHGA